MTTRKPIKRERIDGSHPRSADRQLTASTLQSPPRYTRCQPLAGPLGSVTDPEGYSPYQSEHHSHTLPCMSYKTHALAGYVPTGDVFSRFGPFVSVPYGLVPSQLACLPFNWLPKLNGVIVPARHAYSHSASVGKRYLRPAFFSSGISDNRLQNQTASKGLI